ncbi:formimidoylglutamase [Billgrantia diversa]|uniref:formimidoylglutamase n=1 Tax=Halomonas sp. MCCC 1A13316 TaxID=2733487 RepID=UPI0018D3B1EC|nr:formimidoylglutamase [Halomonas sp. MCCC 1A13316]
MAETDHDLHLADPSIDMSLWAGREDVEPDSLRWHQVVTPYKRASEPGVVLVGFGCDAGVARNQGRVGAAEGPRSLRRALAPLAWHRRAPVFDAGDVNCHGNDDMESAQARLAERLATLLANSQLPVALGGGHEMAYASWSGLTRHLEARGERCPKIGIVNLDAHFDLRDPSQVRSSGTPFAQIAAECEARGWPFRYACLGVSRANNTRALFDRARKLGVLIKEDREFLPHRFEAIQRELERFMAHCDHLYLTVDLDVLPSSEAPGVSAPAARGVALAMIETLIETVRDSGKLRLADFAELNPSFDNDGRTARAAARLIHQLTLDT